MSGKRYNAAFNYHHPVMSRHTACFEDGKPMLNSMGSSKYHTDLAGIDSGEGNDGIKC